MIHFLKFILLTLSVVLFFACQTGSTVNTKEVAAKPNSDPPIFQGKLTGYRDDVCQIEGKDPIPLNLAEGESIFIILRPAETLPARTSLSPIGIDRAQTLSFAFVYSGLQQIYVDENAALQTSTFVSRSNNCPTGTFKDDLLGNEEFVKFLLHNYKGKKVMVIGNHILMTNVLRHLEGTGKYTVPGDEYDHVFIVKTRGLGDSDVYHFKY